MINSHLPRPRISPIMLLAVLLAILSPAIASPINSSHTDLAISNAPATSEAPAIGIPITPIGHYVDVSIEFGWTDGISSCGESNQNTVFPRELMREFSRQRGNVNWWIGSSQQICMQPALPAGTIVSATCAEHCSGILCMQTCREVKICNGFFC